MTYTVDTPTEASEAEGLTVTERRHNGTDAQVWDSDRFGDLYRADGPDGLLRLLLDRERTIEALSQGVAHRDARIEALTAQARRSGECSHTDEELRGLVMNYRHGCDEGKRQFLRELGILDPQTWYVTVSFNIDPDEDGTISDALSSAVSCDDTPDVSCGYVRCEASWYYTEEDDEGAPDSYGIRESIEQSVPGASDVRCNVEPSE